MATTRAENLLVTGTVTAGGYYNVNRDGMRIDELMQYPLDLQNFRVWDAFQTPLGTAGNDDLGITAGAFGTGCPYLTTGDVKTLSGTRYGRILFQLPPEYASGEDVSLNFAAGMLTTVASSSCTIDCEVYVAARDTLKSGSDLVSTAASTINSLTFANKTFVITATGLTPGAILDIRVAIAYNDVATGTAVIGAIAAAELYLDIRG